MNEDEKQAELNEITRMLIRLRPARSQIDSRVVFYEAWFGACQSQLATRRHPRVAPLIAAGLVSVVVVASASYQFGHSAAIQAASENTTRVAVRVPGGDAGLMQEEPPVLGLQREVVSPALIEEPKRWAPTGLFARWIAPLAGLAESAGFETETETTLAVFHSSLVARDDFSRDWINTPFSTTLARHSVWRTPVPANGSESMSPLAASDVRQFAQSLETAR